MNEDIYKKYLISRKVSVDTRTIGPGDMFFALKGEQFDGNQFVAEALKKGCSSVVMDDPLIKIKDERVVLVDDVLQSLQDLARHHRERWGGKVLAITGSNGKTTTKELVFKVLSKKYRVLATKGNLNNHIGVPLTLLQLKDQEIAVIEMGANHQGEIKNLCEIAHPDLGLITNIGKAHLEGFGGIQGVRKGKGELYDYLSIHQGKAIINADDKVLKEMAGERKLTFFTYGNNKSADLPGENRSKMGRVEGSIHFGERFISFHSRIYGAYNYTNILAAAACGKFMNVEAEEIIAAIEEYEADNNRSQRLKGKSNIVIMDAYNANPSSMTEALEEFHGLQNENKMVILGDMLELGDESEYEHKRILELLKEYAFKRVILVGENFFSLSKDAPGYFVFKRSVSDCIAYLEGHKPEDFIVLLKGSRKIALEKAGSLLLDQDLN